MGPVLQLPQRLGAIARRQIAQGARGVRADLEALSADVREHRHRHRQRARRRGRSAGRGGWREPCRRLFVARRCRTCRCPRQRSWGTSRSGPVTPSRPGRASRRPPRQGRIRAAGGRRARSDAAPISGPTRATLCRSVPIARVGEIHVPRNLTVHAEGPHLLQDHLSSAFQHATMIPDQLGRT